jgi:hypothetical protein
MRSMRPLKTPLMEFKKICRQVVIENLGMQTFHNKTTNNHGDTFEL